MASQPPLTTDQPFGLDHIQNDPRMLLARVLSRSRVETGTQLIVRQTRRVPVSTLGTPSVRREVHPILHVLHALHGAIARVPSRCQVKGLGVNCGPVILKQPLPQRTSIDHLLHDLPNRPALDPSRRRATAANKPRYLSDTPCRHLAIEAVYRSASVTID